MAVTQFRGRHLPDWTFCLIGDLVPEEAARLTAISKREIKLFYAKFNFYSQKMLISSTLSDNHKTKRPPPILKKIFLSKLNFGIKVVFYLRAKKLILVVFEKRKMSKLIFF